MPHDIVDFKNSFLGNAFGKIPKFKMTETLDFTDFPKFFPEIYQKWEAQKCFWENEKIIFGRIFILGKSFLGVKIAIKYRRCCYA